MRLIVALLIVTALTIIAMPTTIAYDCIPDNFNVNKEIGTTIHDACPDGTCYDNYRYCFVTNRL